MMTNETLIKYDAKLKADREYNVITDSNYSYTHEPTDVVLIDGTRYRIVERKAEVGENVLDLVDGAVLEIVPSPYSCGKEWYGFDAEHGKGIAPIGQSEYLVLEPVESDDSVQIIDLLANLTRRVNSLENQLADNQRNVERQAEEIATLKYLGASNEEDIRTLDERTQVLNAIQKYYGGAGR